MQELVRLGAPGALALVKERDKIVAAAAGLADLKRERPATKEDVWRIASVTKMVTAVIALQLVRERKLELDHPLSRYLPRIVPKAERITIRQLLNHTSGIPDYLYGRPFSTSKRLRVRLLREQSTAEMIEAANSQRRRFAPGRQHEYSNTNYLLLGLVIEKVSGKPYRDVVSERIVEPLQLQHTGFPDELGIVPRQRLSAYVPSDRGREPFGDYKRPHDVTIHRQLLGADGGLYSDVEDLGKMLEAIWGGKLLGPSEIEAMLADPWIDHDGRYRYGLGVSIYQLSCGTTVVGHEGSDFGSYTLALTDRATLRHLVVVVNIAIHRRPDIEIAIDRLRSQVFCPASR
ncbi:MAG: beta-lactamase family protein [Hyphomicrobiaceae bacterium]|nr:MAG: beta-lactamase family protein [Hyphomicrobiaceae bacterium]